MTQQEILEYNKRCSEFLWPDAKKEYESGEIEIKDGIFKKGMLIFGHFHLMKFHSDWNWIMEVVEAIEKLGYKFQLGWNITALISLVTNTPAKIAFIESENRKEAVVQAINKFLIWYNENI